MFKTFFHDWNFYNFFILKFKIYLFIITCPHFYIYFIDIFYAYPLYIRSIQIFQSNTVFEYNLK